MAKMGIFVLLILEDGLYSFTIKYNIFYGVFMHALYCSRKFPFVLNLVTLYSQRAQTPQDCPYFTY